MQNGILLAMASLLLAFFGVFIVKNFGIFPGLQRDDVELVDYSSGNGDFFDPTTFPSRYPNTSWTALDEDVDIQKGFFEVLNEDEVALSISTTGKSWITSENFELPADDVARLKKELLYKSHVVRGITADGPDGFVDGYILMQNDLIQTIILTHKQNSTEVFISNPTSFSEAQRGSL